MSTIASQSLLNISETVRDRGLVPRTTNRKWPTGGSNGHVTPKGEVVPPIRLKSNISKTAGDAVYQQSLITRQSAVIEAVRSAIY